MWREGLTWGLRGSSHRPWLRRLEPQTRKQALLPPPHVIWGAVFSCGGPFLTALSGRSSDSLAWYLTHGRCLASYSYGIFPFCAQLFTVYNVFFQKVILCGKKKKWFDPFRPYLKGCRDFEAISEFSLCLIHLRPMGPKARSTLPASPRRACLDHCPLRASTLVWLILRGTQRHMPKGLMSMPHQ